ncbi:MAG TPA: molybdopterin molybdotransferase MoeA [Candidatus Paceibacterota bacterium]|nr:molybdopterin molybdotransferase MoeA [Verrucomicrobiota bacterium]HSA09143.1 molybdopterin molybdotransferase MoeA [Candidatus Paceibacterota bacterium]
MLQYEAALARILAAVPAPSYEDVSLSAAAGRVLAEEVRSPIDLPVFDNSAMDGYALRASDAASARPDAPVRLRLTGRVVAGEAMTGEVRPGTCARVFTGSPLPRGADAVVMQEATRLEPGDPSEVLIQDRAKPGENVRMRGEDVRFGARLAEAGETLTAGRIGLLGAAGLTAVRVGRQPLVGLLATGSELREPGQLLAPGQIYESNRVALAALLARVGAVPRILPLVADALASTGTALADAFNQCNAVITTGGVSVGEMDFVRRAFEQIGGKLEFWKVAVRPGRPFAFGRYREKLLFGLPGNPVSALVTFLMLVRPALLRWQGALHVTLSARPGVLAEPLVNEGARRHLLRVTVDSAGRVWSAGLQASHALSSMATANGLVDLPPKVTLAAGATVQVMCWD